MTDTFDISAMKRDMERPRLTKDWKIISDVPAPGWVQVVGPAFKVAGPTTATDLNGEDYMDRHRDARRIARVPEMEAEILRLRAEVDAGLIREKDANARAMQHLRRAEKAEIASRNHVTFSYEWRERAEKAEAECEALEAKLAERVTVAPLEWTPTKVANVQRWTASVMGRAMYEVGVHDKGGAYLMINWRGLSHEVFDDFDYAKAAAQADYSRRVLSALTTAPITPAEAARDALISAAYHIEKRAEEIIKKHLSVPAFNELRDVAKGLRAMAEGQQ